MLYTEFLNGTMEPDNKYTYREYKRIEAIYNSNNDMTKEEAYRLFREPDAFTKELLEDISEYRSASIQKSITIKSLEKEISDLEKKIANQESVRRSLQLTLEECLKEAQIASSRISNLIYG